MAINKSFDDKMAMEKWGEIGARAAKTVSESGEKVTAEQKASQKGLQGTPRRAFVAAFKLAMIAIEKEKAEKPALPVHEGFGMTGSFGSMGGFGRG